MKRTEPAPTGRHGTTNQTDAQWYAHRVTRGDAPREPSDLYRQHLSRDDVRDVIQEIRQWGSF